MPIATYGRNSWTTPLRVLEGIKQCATFSNRMGREWRIHLMDWGTAIAVTGFVVTFFTSSTLTYGSFFFLAVATGTAGASMRYFAQLESLQKSVTHLKESKKKFKTLTEQLQTENGRLSQTAQRLENNNRSFKTTNRSLQTTNRALEATGAGLRTANSQLHTEVDRLSVGLNHFVRGTQEMKQSLAELQGQNGAFIDSNHQLKSQLTQLSRMLHNTDALAAAVSQRLSQQQSGLDQQLVQLGTYLQELRSEHSLDQKMRALQHLTEQHRQEIDRLNETRRQFDELQVLFAAERGKQAALNEALELVRQDLRTETGTFQNNNTQLGAHVTRLSAVLNQPI